MITRGRGGAWVSCLLDERAGGLEGFWSDLTCPLEVATRMMPALHSEARKADSFLCELFLICHTPPQPSACEA